MIPSRTEQHFQRLYRAKDDPWDFSTSAYEQDKYRQTLAALGERRFASGLEAGCSIGVLTRMLAMRCDRLLAIDIVEEPLRAARLRCADQPWVRFARGAIPEAWPDDGFDLIVLSEVLYFLAEADIDRCAAHAERTLDRDGIILLVNWLGVSDDPTSGHDAAERFIRQSGLSLADQRRTAQYRLDVLRKA